jgi:hypothetical protein
MNPNAPAEMTDTEYLAEIQNMCRDMGIKVPATLEEAGRKYNTMAELPTDTAVRTRFKKPGESCGRGTVRKISERQLNYLRNLINTRYYRQIMGEKWFTSLGATSHMDLMVKVESISLKGASTMIDALKGCPLQPAIAEEQSRESEPMVSDRQVSYLNMLLNERENDFQGEAGNLTKAEATDLIGKLKDAPRKAQPKPTQEEIKSVAGLYELDGEIYRMKKARSGNHFYAELLINAETSAFEYAAGMARKVPALGRKLTLAEAEELSGVLGYCCCCGRTLTATVNGIGPGARYIGPICESKYF